MRKFLQLQLLLFLVLFCYSSHGLFAQDRLVGYDLLTIRNGLTHNMALNLSQDKKGVMWIGTFNGLTRYDGPNLVAYKDVLDEGESWANIIECSAVDHLNRVWIGTRVSKGVACYDRKAGKWKKYYTDKRNNAQTSLAIKEDNGGNIWVSFYDGSVGVLVPGDSIIRTIQLQNSPIYLLNLDNQGRIWTGSNKLACLKIRDGKPAVVAEVPVIPLGPYQYVLNGHVDKVAFSTDDGLYFTKVRNQKLEIIKHIPHLLSLQTHLLRKSGAGNILFILQGYIAEYDFEGNLLHEFFFTDELGATPIMDMIYDAMEDRSGIIWICSSHGVLRLRRNMLYVRRLDARSVPVPLLSPYIRGMLADPEDQRVLWLGTRQGLLQKVVYDRPAGNVQKLEIIKVYGPPEPGNLKNRTTINVIYRTRSGKLLAGGLEGLFLINDQDNTARAIWQKKDGKVSGFLEIWSITEDKYGNIWAGSHQRGLHVFTKDLKFIRTITTESGMGLSNNSIWSFLQTRNGETWLGTDSGLFRVVSSSPAGPELFNVYEHPDLKANDIWNLKEDLDGRIWVGSTDGGLFSINQDRTRVKSYLREGDNPGKTICSMEMDHYGAIWASTINGVYRISETDGSETVYTEQDGFVSSTFNFKVSDTWGNGYIIFGAKSGINFFHPDSIYPRVTANLAPFVTEITAREGEKWLEPELDSRILLNHEQNNIRIKWAFPEYSYLSKHRFRYYLKGFDTNWHYSDGNNPQVSFTNLPPGEYEFELQGSLDGTSWEEPVYTVFIVIKPAFWQTLWFRILVILMLALLIVGIVYFRVKGVENRAEERATFNKRSAELELQALQSQMNPHFLFNAINSIQHFILLKDEIRSSDYLSKFAKLMRSFLEASKVRYITLAEELKQLRLYIELEHLRFEDKFNYAIEVDPQLETDQLELPSLLLQPFLENAIGHGLVQRREPGGFLLIGFYKTGDHCLTCVVDDNGIGREKASEIRRMHKPTHRSRGTDLVMDRVKTVNQLKDMVISIHIIDKTSDEGEPQGTRIEITIQYPEQP